MHALNIVTSQERTFWNMRRFAYRSAKTNHSPVEQKGGEEEERETTIATETMNFHWELCAPPQESCVCSNSEYAKGTTPSLLDKKKRLEESKGFGETVSQVRQSKHAVSGAENPRAYLFMQYSNVLASLSY
jgi:hypothetical protein